MPPTSTKASGFTIVEMIVVIVVSGVLAGILFGPFDDLYSSNVNDVNNVVSMTDIRSALGSMQNTLAFSVGFEAANTNTDPAGTHWTSGGGTTSTVLISSNYATSDASSTRTLTLKADCSTPVSNEYVFFVFHTVLYRRTLQGQTTSLCGNCPGGVGSSACINGQPKTCAADSGISGCAVDAKLLNNVTGFTIQYYSSPDSTSPITNPAMASTAIITVTAQSGIGTYATTLHNSIKITPKNQS